MRSLLDASLIPFQDTYLLLVLTMFASARTPPRFAMLAEQR
jgi:hypothetical protein